MNKEQKTSAEMQTQEEFDRSICMSFFGNYRTSVKRIENRYGIRDGLTYVRVYYYIWIGYCSSNTFI